MLTLGSISAKKIPTNTKFLLPLIIQIIYRVDNVLYTECQIGPLSANRYHLSGTTSGGSISATLLSGFPGDFQLERLAYVKICTTWNNFVACLDISALISILHSCSFSTFVYSAIATCISICVIVLKIAAKCLCRGGGAKAGKKFKNFMHN